MAVAPTWAGACRRAAELTASAAGRAGSPAALPNAIKDPQNDTDPMIAANSDATTTCTVGVSSRCEKPFEFRNSLHEINATEPAVDYFFVAQVGNPRY
jgi:hypothetical protein